MFMYQRFVPGLAIASYVVGDEKAKRAVVIDPMRDVDEYIRIAHAEGLHIMSSPPVGDGKTVSTVLRSLSGRSATRGQVR